MKAPHLFSSIPPKLNRLIDGSQVGQTYQRQCIESWRNAGFQVVSVNPDSELDAIRAMNLPMEVRGVSDTRMPRIRDILQAAVETRSELCAIVNADCEFIKYGDIANKIASLPKRTLFIAERVDIGPDARSPIPGNCGGFDAFFFDPGLVEGIETSFRIGDPWWDYWFPCELASRGCSVHRLTTPLVLHLTHPLRWRPEEWLDNGNYFREQLTRQLATPNCNEKFRQFFANIDVATITLNVLSKLVQRWLRSQDDTLDVRFLPLTQPTAEQLLRSLRDCHSVEVPKHLATSKWMKVWCDRLKFALDVTQTKLDVTQTKLDVTQTKLDVTQEFFDEIDNTLSDSFWSHLKGLSIWPWKIIRHQPFYSALIILLIFSVLALCVLISIQLQMTGLFWWPLALIAATSFGVVVASYFKGKIQPLRHQLAAVRVRLQGLVE